MWDKPGRLNWFWRSPCEGLSSFNPKRFYYSCADLAVHFKEELPFTRENSADSYLCSRLTLPHSVSYFFFFSFSLGVFYSVSSNTDQVLSINLSANKFVFGEFNVHHKDWLILVELLDLVNSAIVFLSQTTLLRWLTFLLGSQTDSQSLALLNLFISSDASICSTMVFLHWEILIMLFSQFPLTFHQIHNGMSHFIAQLMTSLVLTGIVFVIICWDVPWEDIFKLSASTAASEFCGWVQVGTDLFPLAAGGGAIVHRNHYFHLYQQNKSPESKAKLRQASSHCKRVLETAKTCKC